MPAPVLLAYNEKDVIPCTVTSTQTITKGDIVKATAGNVYTASTATNDAAFVGIALDSSADGDTDDIAVVIRGLVEIDATSASYRVGAGLLIAGTNTVEDDAGANTIAWVAENTSSASRIKVYFDAPALQKLFEVNA